jgi:hypothetical protein
MEGITIGEDTVNNEWLIGINYEIYNKDNVTGWHYHSEEPYKIIHEDMILLDTEYHIAPLCFVQWLVK